MNRAELADRFSSSSSRSPWKTFVIEAHANGDPGAMLGEVFGSQGVSATDDVHLHEVGGDTPLVVDHLDGRFWSVHTTAPVGAARALLRGAVESWRELDRVWLPSDHLGNVWPGTSPRWLATDFRARRLSPQSDVGDLRLSVSGTMAEELLRAIEGQAPGAVSRSAVGVTASDDDLGTVVEGISRDGRFVAYGDDFGFHQAIVARVVDRYRHFVESVEQRALTWTELDGGGARLSGGPVVLRFSRSILDLERFLDGLFSAREPFRLWGIPQMTGEERAEVEAVDLHVGQPVRFDIAPEWMRVYLFAGGCGNSVARLVANLQHHFDGQLQIVDDELDAGIRPATATA
ncbi:MAG: hypothetical protein AB1673_15350 [Actinomycetota bacterium]